MVCRRLLRVANGLLVSGTLTLPATLAWPACHSDNGFSEDTMSGFEANFDGLLGRRTITPVFRSATKPRKTNHRDGLSNLKKAALQAV